MIKLSESQSYDVDVNGYETGEVVQGGQNGVANRPLKALANRTNWLKSAYDAIVLTLQGINTVLGGLKSASTYEATANKIDGKIPLWDSVYSKNNVDQLINDVEALSGKKLASGRCMIGDLIGGNSVTKVVSIGKNIGTTYYTVLGSIISKGDPTKDWVFMTIIDSSQTATNFSISVVSWQGADLQNVDFKWIIFAD